MKHAISGKNLKFSRDFTLVHHHERECNQQDAHIFQLKYEDPHLIICYLHSDMYEDG